MRKTFCYQNRAVCLLALVVYGWILCAYLAKKWDHDAPVQYSSRYERP